MQKWEYRKLHVGDMSQPVPVGAALDEIGEQGWELVCSSGGWLFFKRPMQPIPPALMVVNVNGNQMNKILEAMREELDIYFKRPTGG